MLKHSFVPSHKSSPILSTPITPGNSPTHLLFFSFIFSLTLSIFLRTALPGSDFLDLTLSWWPRQCRHLQGHLGFFSAGGSRHPMWYFRSQLQQHSRQVEVPVLPKIPTRITTLTKKGPISYINLSCLY